MTDHEAAMRAAIAEAERARGSTGDNPWVGCVIVDAQGAIVARGHTQGPGEDHAEIVAMHEAHAAGVDLASVTLYSTLEPCAFHGRTPACARAIADRGVLRVVTGILDPNPRVDGAGLAILREAGIDVTSEVCAKEITRQLAPWIFAFHPHEPQRRARTWIESKGVDEAAIALADWYGIDASEAAKLVRAS
jgi:diaminohydroxyphosphoribosylaminopyrimidine deaminase/5-amino-6-(5-phosphoribosylamino)uracil reductase